MPENPLPESPSAILDAERAHLAASRDALHRMRDETQAWQEATGGDRLSTQYLRQMLFRRRAELENDPDTPLFFGRLDYAHDLGAEYDEVVHVGRRHVTGHSGGDPLVIDWRAPMSLPFYRARAGEPMRCRLRRRFGFQHGELTAFEDELLDAAPASGEQASQLLQAEIERPRTGPMRDIVATIQPDQDVLVRTDLGTSLAIQGAPGTGKTAVGLHRAAWLLFAFREQLSRAGVLVIGPNASFLSYIGDVLPALGEIDATQETIESLVGRHTGLAVKADDPAAVAVLKGDARMAAVCHRAVWGHLRQPTDMLVVPIGARQWRVPAHHLQDAVDGLVQRGVRYEAGRAMLPQRLAHQVLLRMEATGETTDDRVQNQVARTTAVKQAATATWPRLDARKLAHRLLTDADFLAQCAEGILTADEQALLLGSRRPARSPGSMRWTLADLVLVDEIADLLNRTPSQGHVIVDEAQDLSPMQLRAVGRRATTGSVTLLGDLAQATTPWATSSWTDALAHVGHPEARVSELVEGFRVPGTVIDYAARLLPAIAPDLTPPRAIRHDRGELVIERTDTPLEALVSAATTASEREGTLGIIVADAEVATVSGMLQQAGLEHHTLGATAATPDASDVEAAGDAPSAPDTGLHRVDVVPASLAKGLEFDHVVLLEPAAIVAGEPDEGTGLRRLYVCLTRAVTSLVVVHGDEVPALLRRGVDADREAQRVV